MSGSRIIIYQSHLNPNTYNYCWASKEISMKQHSLAECLLQLRGKLQLEGTSDDNLLTFDQLHAQITRQAHQHHHLAASLTQKQAELKLTHKKLKKTTNKLTRKAEECESLKKELTRFKDIYQDKVELFRAQAEGFRQDPAACRPQPRINMRKNKLAQEGSQCQILKESAFNELSAHNQILRTRLQETQKALFEEKIQRETLACLMEVEQDNSEDLENELIKDNSTDDAGSQRGDLLEFEDQSQVGQEDQGQPLKPFVRKENILSRIWQYGETMYHKLTRRN